MGGDRSFVPPAARARLRGAAVPVALSFGRLGLSPNALTVVGFGIAVLAAVAAGLQAWLLAAGLVIFGGAFDLLDGALARATGRVSRFGAFLDSTLDRLGEGVVYVGVVAAASAVGDPRLAVLAAGAMVLAFQVSYTRARAEGVGYRGDVGIAPRAERVVILTLGLLGAGLDGGVGPGGGGARWLGLALAVIALLAAVTVIQRIWYVRSQAHLTQEE
ncbi:MAG TPA: CDP-alcohol phosphatidyltransferase family protein [Candidatus Limnocylindrales bacterium]